MVIRPHDTPVSRRQQKGSAHCAICAQSRRPVGLPRQESDGWAVYRWNQPASFVSGLATKRDAFRLLWALKHRWQSCYITFRNGRTVKLSLTEMES